MTQKTRRGWGERERFLSQIARAWITLFLRRPQYLAKIASLVQTTQRALVHFLAVPTWWYRTVRPSVTNSWPSVTNLGHPDRTARYLLSVFQKYIYQCFLALGIRDLRLPITTYAISTALFLDTWTFLKAKQSYTISFQYNILSHT